MGKRRSEKKSQPYLEYVKLSSFGSFANRVIGPFGPGLNVVYGANEAGKTTVSQMIRGVLFGWPRSGRDSNPYRPESAERVGSLFFSGGVSRENTELKRVKNTDALDDEFGILSDIDVSTYDTMFSLTSDELMDLKSHDQVTSHLLTAASGTASSPAHALVVIDDEIKKCLSRSKNEPGSLVNLKERESALKEKVRRGAATAQDNLSQRRQLEELEQRLVTLADVREALESESDVLKRARYDLASLDEEIDSAQRALREAKRSAEGFVGAEDVESDELSRLSTDELSQIRAGLDDKKSRLERAEHSLQVSIDNETASRVSYEAIAGDPDLVDGKRRSARQRRVKLVLAVVFSLCMVCLSSLMLLRALDKPSMSMLVAAVVFLVGALAVCAAGFAMNFRPSQVEEEMSDRLKKAEWVMRQDALIRKENERSLDFVRADIAKFLSSNHLSHAGGSLPRAYELLDQALASKSARDQEKQRRHAVDLQVGSLNTEIEALVAKRKELCLSSGLGPSAKVSDLDSVVSRKTKEENKTVELIGETSRRCGELKSELEAALGDWDFDSDKLELQKVQTSLSDVRDKITTLLVAKVTLSDAIAAWEKTSQPEVYRRASELLSLMTDGVWQRVFMDADGKICVMDAVRTTREPRLLSTGTRQQLYLALRIALLLTADSVGRSIPVVCDDILVNFDSARRKGAIEALATLAQKRQVILFTCHSDVAKQVARIEPKFNYIEL